MKPDMENLNTARALPPFPPDYRASGLLFHVTSLPSPYGIGDQCLSSFVGNCLMISPEYLIEDGMLRAGECRQAFSSTAIDYDLVIPFKHRLLKLVWSRFQAGVRNDLRPAYEQFCHSRAGWLDEYALFRALKAKYQNTHYLEWPHELVQRTPSAMAQARRELRNEIDQVRFAQFLLFRQGTRLKEYAREKGVRLIGDLPFFVSPDSSDVWANPELFLLDKRGWPRFVAGVPPDYFSAQGQLWGNPVYNWDVLRCAGYAWYIERIRALLAHVDVIRLDHFRAFAAAWHVAAGACTAETGEWVPGPGSDFFITVQRELGRLPFLAEDLGVITPDVAELLEQFQIPGTRVLQFAFDGSRDNPHLPAHYSTNTVVYTGTHDNPTTREWYEGLPERERCYIWQHLKRPAGEARDVASELIRVGWYSPAALAITPMQDILNLGREGRMNTPGSAQGNWRWRATPNMLSTWNLHWLRDLTRSSNRSGAAGRRYLEVAS